MKEKRNYYHLGWMLFIVLFCLHYCIKKNFPSLLMDAFYPLILGGAIAYVINILMSFYERHYFPNKQDVKFKRPICMIAAIITILIVMWLLIMLIVPQFVSCIRTLIQKAPIAIETLLSIPQITMFIPDDFATQLANFNWNELLTQAANVLGSIMPGITGKVSSFVGSIVTIFFSLIFTFYFLIGKDKMMLQSKRLMRNYLNPKWRERVMHIARLLNTSFHNYITGQFLEAIILGTLCFIGMIICRFPYAALIGVFVGMTGLLPMVGAYIGAFVGAFMILSVSPEKALLFLIFIVVLQQIEGNLIYPKVVGTSVGLPALWTLVAVTVGGSLGGIIGMFLGVPIASALYLGVKEDMEKREREHRIDSKRRQDE